jgi:peroxiredoxin
VDARTGETFTLADFAGKTVFIEPMATWCTNCRRQIPNAEAARQQLDPDQYVFIGLSVAENVDNATLAEYVDAQGWNFTFAVASAELTQGLIDTFGRTVVTPPSTPHFIIRPDGTLSEIQTGTHTAEDLIAELTQG